LTSNVPIRDAATVIVLRDQATDPKVLMGQRGKTAVFMPGKFVFPGGAIDQNDHQVPVHGLPADTTAQLNEESLLPAHAIAAAAVRELWEETGQILGQHGEWTDAPQGWRGFAKSGFVPFAPFEFFFRAVTPEGRPRRFDARFLLLEADHLQSDIDDFSLAEDELSHLQWIPLHSVCQFDLPFITKVVLAELEDRVANGPAGRTVPFFRNDDEGRLVSRIGGAWSS